MLDKKLSEYKIIIGIDLATTKSGCCIFDILNNKPIEFKKITVSDKSVQREFDLYNLLSEFLKEQIEIYGVENILLVREALSSQMGFNSQISTFISLAKSHGILSLIIQKLKLTEYSSNIFSISIKPLFKNQFCADPKKPTKEEIRKQLSNIYGFNELNVSTDESDSLAIIHCLIMSKINKDINERIKELKKEIKILKLDSAKQKRLEEINKLTTYLI